VVNAQPTAPAAATASTTVQPTCAVATGTITVSAPLGAGYEYSIDGGAYQLSPTFPGISSGPHAILVRRTTDITCISAPVTVTVNAQPGTPAAPVPGTIIQPTCALTTGSVVLNGLPATGTWIINPGGISGTGVSTTISGLTAGTSYTFTVTNSGGCTSAASVSVIINGQPSPPVLKITDPPAVCFPATVDLTAAAVTSGSSPGTIYSYWTDAAGTIVYNSPANATDGIYYIKSTAISGCYDIKQVRAKVNPLPVVNRSQTNVLCFGESNGAIDISVATGKSPFVFDWTGAGVVPASEDQAGLASGLYSVIVTDANSCSSGLVQMTITQPSALSGNITSQKDVSVSGGNDGSVTVSGSGGTSPYLYKLGAGSYQPSGTFGSLISGSYKVTVQDKNLCTSDVNVTILQPSSTLSGSITSFTDVLCFGTSSGTVTAVGAGGATPYTYRLDAGSYQPSGTFGTISAGSHKVTIRDAVGVTFDLDFTIAQPLALGGTVTSQTNALCSGSNNGSVTVAGSGGISPYKYKIGAGTYQNSGTFGSLAAGSYSLTVQDANLCTFTVQVVITSPPALSLSADKKDVSCLGVADGKITLTITGGTPQYDVLWADGVKTVDRKNLAAGTYSVVVTDKNGCAASLNVVIENKGSEDCLEIQEIITPNNDGYFDRWKIKNIELFPNAEVHVFDRWGKQVFSTKNISANEWDGTFNGTLLPTDSYHYILYLNDGSEPRSGVVSIIR
jgi:gliding motility-associated-like protein